MKQKIMPQLFLLCCLTAFAQLANANMIFSATLSGDQEVPPVVTAATGNATGELTGSAGSWVFTYEINYADLESPIADVLGGGHLHNAPAGANGGVVHLFDTPPPFLGTTSGTILGDWRFDDAANPLTDALALELMAGNIYINIHTEQNTSGELRGQFTRVPEPFTWLLMATGIGIIARQRTRR